MLLLTLLLLILLFISIYNDSLPHALACLTLLSWLPF
jgi:hypothetical protein